MGYNLELEQSIRAILGEGPVWDDRKHLLYWTDIIGETIHVLDPYKNKTVSKHVGMQIGSFALSSDKELILAGPDGFYKMDTDTDGVECIKTVKIKGDRFNDGKCDAKGRFWAGTIGEKGQGELFYLDTNYEVKKVLDGVSISNGITWSMDNKTMYYIDSLSYNVVSYDFDLEKAELSNKRTLIQIPTEWDGVPDGMTIDDAGNLWIALWGAYSVSKWSPEGKLLDRIPIPARNVTSCCFGGLQMDTLYITTASVDTGDADLKMYPESGSVFSIKTNTKGKALYRFGAKY